MSLDMSSPRRVPTAFAPIQATLLSARLAPLPCATAARICSSEIPIEPASRTASTARPTWATNSALLMSLIR